MARTGTVARVAGVVVDAEFASGDLPSIHDALLIQRDDESALVIEVQEHVDPRTVRAIAMGGTAGLRRGLTVLDTGQPIRVPVGHYEPTVAQLVPPQVPAETGEASAWVRPWPPPIIETDPANLYDRVAEQWTAVTLYRLLLDSAAAEHSARYQLMEAASQNAEQLIAELTLAVQAARQQEITQEMQELTAGAGLIGPR